MIFRLALPLRVLSVVPASGDALGGAAITVTGKGFPEDPILRIGGYAVPVLGVTPTEITTLSPPVFPGTLNDVLVTRSAGVGQLTLGWFADFLDVPQADPFHSDVEKVVRHHIAVGVGGGLFGRNDPVTRAQIAVLLVKTANGAAFEPAPCTGVFGDVTCPSLFASWIEEVAREQWTAGCQQSPALYCPASSVTRAQFAVLLLKALHGSDDTPPACQGVFEDVACPGGFAVYWIEELDNEGISTGCSTSPALYCPGSPTKSRPGRGSAVQVVPAALSTHRCAEFRGARAGAGEGIEVLDGIPRGRSDARSDRGQR